MHIFLSLYTKDCIFPGINTYKNYFLAMKDPFPYNTFAFLKKQNNYENTQTKNYSVL